MIAYKGMCPGMVCLGYQLKKGLNVTEQANCQANGFHCAANPMDCLRYYPVSDAALSGRLCDPGILGGTNL